MPDVTPPQDAKFKIDLKDLLRPYHTYANDVLPLAGMYFLKRYTKKFRDKAGNKVEEEIKLFDEVRCSFPTTTRWMVVSITGAPFDHSRKRCALIAPNSDLLVFQDSGRCCSDGQQQLQTVLGSLHQHHM